MIDDTDEEPENDENLSDTDDNADPVSTQSLEEIAAEILASVDTVAAMNHRFEYHIFHAGDVHRIGRVAISDLYDLVWEWVSEKMKEPGAVGLTAMKLPFHVFMDGKLWGVLTFRDFKDGKARFDEVAVTFGAVDDAELLDELRAFEWPQLPA